MTDEKRNFRIEDLEKTNPFRVPEGYFAQLQQSVMSQLPAEPVRASGIRRARIIRMALSAAASVCIAVAGVVAYLHFIQEPNAATTLATAETSTVSADYDTSADYIILDNEMLYSYISEQ